MPKLKKRIHKDTMKLAGIAKAPKGKGVVLNKYPKSNKGHMDKAGDKSNLKRDVQVNSSKKEGKDYFCPPRPDEWKSLHEGDAQYHANFFKLQADDFLSTVHKNQEYVGGVVDKWLPILQSFIKSLDAKEEKWNIAEPMPWMKNIKLPFKLPASGLKGSFQFVAPKRAPYAIGSLATNTTILIENAAVLDVAIEMPKEFFQTADYLNYVYHYKKALYLSYIVHSAKRSKQMDLSKSQFLFLEGNPLLPVLVVPLPDTKINIQVRLRLILEQGVFKLNRFIPQRNNIRATALDCKLSAEKEKALISLPTYHYNNSILRDLVLKENHTLMVNLIANFPSVADAIVLLKYWLRRRKLERTLSSEAVNLLICYLIKTKKVNPTAMTYYQIIRIFFSQFHQVENTLRFITLNEATPGADGTPPYHDVTPFSELCFFDVTGFFNIFSTISGNDWRRISLECQKSIQMIDKSQTNAFQWLFLSEVPSIVTFDHVFHLDYTKDLEAWMLNPESSHIERLFVHGLDVRSYLMEYVGQILAKGLGNRIKTIQIISPAVISWDTKEQLIENEKSIAFGIIIDPDHAFDVIVKGPQANDPAAAEFRAFWGEKSQLRRFKDGSVTEACVFGGSGDTPTEKRLITMRMVNHLLKIHLTNRDTDQESLWTCRYFANQLNCTLKEAEATKKFNIPDMETLALSVIREFNQVEMQLRQLEGLPLEITGIVGTSPIFYYADPKKNLPNGYCGQESDKRNVIYGEAIYRAVLTLAISGKWPDDLAAIQRLKAAFYMEIGKRLRGVKGFFTSPNVDSIDILKGGYTFRFILAHVKELSLLKQTVSEGMVRYRDTDYSLHVEKQLFIKPTLASALHGLHQQHNAYGQTVCLAKQWLNSQLLDSTLWPDECTELLVASLFLEESQVVTLEPHVQPQAGFFRFLHLMASKNWETECLLLNFNKALSQEQIEEIQTNFTMNRSQFPPLCIVTAFDEKYTGIWTKHAPILPVSVRMIMLAKELLERLAEKVHCKEKFSNNSVFATQFTGYDVIINVDTKNLKFLKTNLLQSSARLPANFNPVYIYLKELRAAYGDVALFFCNGINPEKIGVLWKPATAVPRDFRISDVNCRYRVGDRLIFDKAAICKDFLLIGHGIAVNVE